MTIGERVVVNQIMNQSGQSMGQQHMHQLRSHKANSLLNPTSINIDEDMEVEEDDLLYHQENLTSVPEVTDEQHDEEDIIQYQGLDTRFDSTYINVRLERAPKFKRAEVDFDLYPLEDADVNAVKFIHSELLFERNQVYKYYINQGFQGKFLVILVDELIDGARSVLNDINSLDREDKSKLKEECLFYPSLLIHDSQLLQLQHTAKVASHLVEQATKVIKEIRKLNTYLGDQCDAQTKEQLERESKLVRKAKQMLTQKSFSMGNLAQIDLAKFTRSEKDDCMRILNLEQAKIKTFLQFQANKREDLEQLENNYSLSLEHQRNHIKGQMIREERGTTLKAQKGRPNIHKQIADITNRVAKQVLTRI